jgi:hypothetical protein
VKLPSAVHAVAALLCAGLIFVLASCGGSGSGVGSNFTGGGGSGSGTQPLVITTTTLPQGITNVTYQQTLTASGGTPPYTWSQYALPIGLTLGPSTGMITGTMDGAVFGPVQFTVSDSGNPRQTATQTISMTFIWQLSFLTTSLPAAHTSAPYDAVINLTANADPTTWKLVSGTLPQGMQLSNPTAQQIEITGTTTQTGTYPLTVQIQDNSTPPQVGKQDFVLTVDNALAILTQNLGSAIRNANYSVTLSATNGTPPYQWSAIGLPTLLAIDPGTGTISGVPTVNGLFHPTVTVTDAAGHTASQLVGLNITAALTILKFEIFSAVVTKNFFSSLSAFGGVPPYTWSLASGSLPAGLTLDGAHGTISGTPTQSGTSNVTFQVTDTGPPQQTANWPTTIAVTPPTFAITSILSTKLPMGVSVNWIAAAQGGTPPYHWSLLSGATPTGLTFDANSAELTGEPTTLGAFTFTLQVTDSGSPVHTTNATYSVNVTTSLGRNDTVAHATALSDGSHLASISPYADPPDNPSPVPDTDYYKIIGSSGTTLKIWTSAQAVFPNNPLDTVLEIVDANGVRLTTCQQPGDTSNTFTSDCLNDDIVTAVNRDSQLELSLPGAANTATTVYAHVFDWRGDARPDMQYYLNISGSVPALTVYVPQGVDWGNGGSPDACLVGSPCFAQFFAIGGTPPLKWAIDSGNAPPGMTLDSASGKIIGTPVAAGTYSFIVRVTDAGTPPQTASVNYTLNIDTLPTITTTSLPDIAAGQPFTFPLAETGGTRPLYWTLTSFDGQLSIQLDPLTGVLTGTAHAPNTDNLTVGLHDSLGLYSFTNLTLNIKPGPFQFPMGSYSAGKVGVLYADSTPLWTVVGGLPPYTVTMLGGTVPPGLTFYGGAISGTPVTAGTYTLSLQASDSSSPPQTLTATYTITINP